MAFDNTLKRSCLYDLGWIRQKSGWLKELNEKAGCRIEMTEMEPRLRAQIATGAAYVDENKCKTDELHASYIRLNTGVIAPAVKTGDKPRYVILQFSRNQYDLWTGIDILYGDVVEIQSESEGQKATDSAIRDIYWPVEMFDGLVEMAVFEHWGNEYGPCGVLSQYLRYMYLRLKREGKTPKSVDGEWMAFDTGLVASKTLEPIVAVCRENPGHAQPWVLDRFVVWSGESVSQRALKRRFKEDPERVAWFKSADERILDPQTICWDGKDNRASFLEYFTKKGIPTELLVAIANESGDARVIKLTTALQNMEVSNIAAEKDLRTKTYNDAVRLLGKPPDVCELAWDRLERAIETTRRYQEWEENVAVPMWDPESDSIVFMLPLSFGDNPLKTDMVLRLTKQSAIKDGSPCFSPQPPLMKPKYAYSNARLLGRPAAFWLRDYIEQRQH